VVTADPRGHGCDFNLDVDPNGPRVLALLPETVEDRQSADHVTLMLNFADEVRRRLTRESK
jgi:hypothetical protein